MSRPPILTSHLFAPLHRELVELLRGLPPEAWDRPTVAGNWAVRDVAAHMLDTQARRLAYHRDEEPLQEPDEPIRSYDDLVRFLDELNADWVRSFRRISPPVLIDLLEVVGPQAADFYASLDPMAPALFPVAWAGEDVSYNWMDVGRDYTELWHHQAQIRRAVDAIPLTSAEWTSPLLALSALAIPPSLSHLSRPKGTTALLRFVGEGGGEWSITSNGASWRVDQGTPVDPVATIEVEASEAWLLFFNALSGDGVHDLVETSGDRELIVEILKTRSVMVKRPE